MPIILPAFKVQENEVFERNGKTFVKVRPFRHKTDNVFNAVYTRDMGRFVAIWVKPFEKVNLVLKRRFEDDDAGHPMFTFVEGEFNPNIF